MAEEQVLEPGDTIAAPDYGEEETKEIPRDATVGAEPQEAAPVDELAVLRQELAEARAKEAEYLDGWQRARAELSNARKRFQRDQEQAYANARADVLTRLLPIVDDFERAGETLPEELSNGSWVGGVLLIQRKLQTLLDQDGVVPIEAAGNEFDPMLHQAVTHEPCDDVPEGLIIGEVQKGYCMGDRVLRPSMVRVSAGPAAIDADAEAE